MDKWTATGGKTQILTFEDLATYLKISNEDERLLIEELINASVEEIEGKLGYPISYTTVEIYCNAANGSLITIPNITAISTIKKLVNNKFIDSTIVVNEIEIVKGKVNTQLMHTDFLNDTFKLAVTVSLFNTDLVKLIIKKLVASKYENREDHETKTYNRDIDILIANHKAFL